MTEYWSLTSTNWQSVVVCYVAPALIVISTFFARFSLGKPKNLREAKVIHHMILLGAIVVLLGFVFWEMFPRALQYLTLDTVSYAERFTATLVILVGAWALVAFSALMSLNEVQRLDAGVHTQLRTGVWRRWDEALNGLSGFGFIAYIVAVVKVVWPVLDGFDWTVSILFVVLAMFSPMAPVLPIALLRLATTKWLYPHMTKADSQREDAERREVEREYEEKYGKKT